MSIKTISTAVIGAAAIGLSVGAFTPIQAATVETVVSFDDLIGSSDLPSNYGGINWGANWQYYNFFQEPYTPSSGNTRSYNLEIFTKVTPEFSFTKPVTFNGAYFSGVNSVSVQFQLLLGGSQVFLSNLLSPTSTPTFLASNYSGLVDQVRVLGGNGGFWVMDDVTYTASSNSAAVPTPALIPGLIGMGVAALRKRKQEQSESEVADTVEA